MTAAKRNLYPAYAACVDTPDALQRLENMLSVAPVVAYDCETGGRTPQEDGLSRNSQMVGFSVAVDNNNGFYVPLRHVQTRLFDPTPNNVSPDKAQTLLRTLFTRRNATIIAHNLQFELAQLRKAGIPPQSIKATCRDTAVESWLCDPNERKALDLLTLGHFAYQMQCIDFSKERAEEVGLDRMVPYACDDVRWLISLHQKQTAWMRDFHEPLLAHYHNVEIPLVFAVEQMESNGVRIDVENAERIRMEMHQETASLEKQIEQMFEGLLDDRKPCISSADWISDVVIDELGWLRPLQERNKKGKWSIAKESIETWIKGEQATTEGVSFIQALERWRMLDKLQGTYLNSLVHSASDDPNHRIYAHFNPIGTVTGRFSSYNPNLQNLPSRTEEGRSIRGAFVPSLGGLMYDADFSQIELRVMAHYSQDPNLLDAYNNNKDIHQRTADLVGCSRSAAKAINFGLIYGMQHKMLAIRTKSTPQEAAKWRKNYFEQYVGVAKFLERHTKLCAMRGFVRTITGRHRFLQDAGEPTSQDHFKIKSANERIANNTVIQGSAADMMKIAMVNLHQEIVENGWSDRVKIVAQIHDELLLDIVDPSLGDKVAETVVRCMESAITLTVPIIADGNLGSSWLDCKS